MLRYLGAVSQSLNFHLGELVGLAKAGHRFTVHGTLYMVHGTRYMVHGTGYMVHCAWYIVLNVY